MSLPLSEYAWERKSVQNGLLRKSNFLISPGRWDKLEIWSEILYSDGSKWPWKKDRGGRMEREKYVIGLDYGTLSGRAVLVSCRDGEIFASAERKYPHGVMETVLPDGDNPAEGRISAAGSGGLYGSTGNPDPGNSPKKRSQSGGYHRAGH